MGLLYYTFDSNVTYSTLRINGATYPSQGVVRGVYDASVDPSSVSGWKGPWYDLAHNKVTKIIIENPIEVVYGNSLFYGLSKVTTIEGIENICGGLINGSKMFSGLSSLTTNLNLTGLRTVNCTNMENMFSYTGSVSSGITIDISALNMGNVTNASQMFKASNAKIINMKNCNTSAIVLGREMFMNCNYLTTIYGTEGQFNMGNVSDGDTMFAGAVKLPGYSSSKIDKSMAKAIASGGYIEMEPISLVHAKTRIQLKYDTFANWMRYDPTPLKGEVCIESTSRKLKVGDGIHKFSELEYYGGYDTDKQTILETSEGTIYVPIDNDTIKVGADGLLHASKGVTADEVTVHMTSEGKIFLKLNADTLVVNAAGEIEALAEKIDNKTVIRNASGELEIPVDGSTIYVDTDGKIKAKGQVTPGKALEWNASNPTTLDVKMDDATIGIQGTGTASGKLSVNYDGGTIYWDTSTPGMFGNGALRAQETRAGNDGTIVETLVGHNYELKVPIDNDTIYLDGGLLKSKGGTVKDIKVDNNSIVDSEGIANIPFTTSSRFGVVKLKSWSAGNINNDGKGTIFLNPQPESGITNRIDGNGIINGKNIDFAVKAALTDGKGSAYTEAEKKAARERIGADTVNVDDHTIKIDSEGKIFVPIDEQTLTVNDDGKLVAQEAIAENGLYTRSTNGYQHYIGIDTDNTTIIVNSEGKLTATAAEVKADNKTIQTNQEGKIFVPIDNNTLRFNDSENWIEVKGYDLTAENGIYIREDDSEAYIGVDVDNKTIFINSEGKLEGAPNMKADERTIVLNSEGAIEVAIDNNTIIYNEAEEWIEVEGTDLTPENGVYIKDDSEGLYIGVLFDGTSITLNSEGKLQSDSLPKPYEANKFLKATSEGLEWANLSADNRTIVNNAEGNLEVAIDNDTIVYNEEKDWVEVQGKDLVPEYPTYIREDSEAMYIGTLYDDETIFLNDRKELTTQIGGGYSKEVEEVIIASGGSAKIRHHSLPSDFADYTLNTIYFPDVSKYGAAIECAVDSDIANIGNTATLYWNAEELNWSGMANNCKIIVNQTGSRVETANEFEAAQQIGNALVKIAYSPRKLMYVDNKFIKVDNETILVNSEGELEAVAKPLSQGKGIIIDSEGKVNVDPGQGLGINLTTNKIAALDATKNVKGVVKYDDVTIKKNSNYQLYVDTENMVDRGLDVTNGKIGHTNSIAQGSKGSKWAVPEIVYDGQGHIKEIQDVDIPTMTGATASSAGERGFVPAPAAGKENCYLRGDGQWSDLVGAGLFRIITVTNSWYAGTDRRSCVFTAAPTSGETIIAPLNFSVDKDVEGLDIIYPVEFTKGHITLSARSNTASDIKVTATCYWLVIKAS